MRHDGEHVLVAVRQDLTDLLRRARSEDQLRLASVLAHPVRVVWFDVIGRVGGDAVDDGRGAVAEKPLEKCDVFV